MIYFLVGIFSGSFALVSLYIPSRSGGLFIFGVISGGLGALGAIHYNYKWRSCVDFSEAELKKSGIKERNFVP